MEPTDPKTTIDERMNKIALAIEQLEDICMKLTTLVTNIRPLGKEIKELYLVKKLLHPISPNFLQIASFIEQSGNLETIIIEKAIGSSKAQEERTKEQSENTGAHSYLPRRSGKRKKVVRTNYFLQERNGKTE